MVDPRAETGFSTQPLDQRGLGLELAVDDLQGPLRAQAAGGAINGGVGAMPEARDELVAADAGAPQLLDVYHGVTSTLLLMPLATQGFVQAHEQLAPDLPLSLVLPSLAMRRSSISGFRPT